MNPQRPMLKAAIRSVTALICTFALLPGDTLAVQTNPPSTQSTQSSAPKDQPVKISPDQLDSLVAPIALYPDPLLAQTLAASTYPLELIQLQQWMAKNSTLKDKALADAVAKQPWDPSIQAMAGLPDVVKRLADDIQWTTELGNAFLAQQSDVMDAVQRMRKKAQDSGAFKSNEQQKVETKVVENKSVIVIEQTNPQVVYVPSYDPVVVYGPPVYPYPPIYYPPAGYYAAGMAISFGVGMAMGAFWGGGAGWGCGWGGNNNVYINHNNNFVRNTDVRNGNFNKNNVGGRGGNNSWQHNPQHRGGAPYGDRNTADKFGGSARGDSLSNRQSNARQQGGGQLGNQAGNRAANTGSNARAGGGLSDSSGSRAASRGGGNGEGFGGGSKGYSGSGARASSNRGSSSMGSRSSGMSRGGGGRSGGGGRRR
jgi:hypothetical protein